MQTFDTMEALSPHINCTGHPAALSPRYHMPFAERVESRTQYNCYQHTPTDRSPWDTVIKVQHSTSFMENESSPRRVLTIDALCGGPTKKRTQHRMSTPPDTPASRVAYPVSRRFLSNPYDSMESRISETVMRPLSRSSTESDDATSVDTFLSSEAEQIPAKKRQRYLRDVDRRSIIRRIDNGEKQASLAREFGVTRAAICHIKKNRNEIVLRYDALVASAKEMERVGSTPSPTSPLEVIPFPQVEELKRPSVLMLLTTLRDVTTSHRKFRASADRLVMLLLEEAIASMATVKCQVQTTNGQTVGGLKSARSLCCVSVGQKGMPLVSRYHQIEPWGSVGSIELRRNGEEGLPVADHFDLPPELTTDSCVLLVSCSTATGHSVCAAIHALLEGGVAEENICVAVLVCTTNAVYQICRQFPGVHVVTCAVEETKSHKPLSTKLSDFLERYEGVNQNNALVMPLPTTSSEWSSVSNYSDETTRPLAHKSNQWPWTQSRIN